MVHWKVPDEKAGDPTLFDIALEWIREDTYLRRQRDKERGKMRGARKGDVSPPAKKHRYGAI